jgi:hypothetical protein
MMCKRHNRIGNDLAEQPLSVTVVLDPGELERRQTFALLGLRSSGLLCIVAAAFDLTALVLDRFVRAGAALGLPGGTRDSQGEVIVTGSNRATREVRHGAVSTALLRRFVVGLL